MQDPKSGSTLELVVDEQQLGGMSRIDLNSSPTIDPDPGANNNYQRQHVNGNLFNFDQIRRWPDRFRESFNAKLNEAKSNSSTKTEYVCEVIHAFSGVLIWSLCFLCTIVIPVILFILGLVNIDYCADRPALPYLVFAIGFVMTASNLFNLAMALDLPVLSNHQLLSSDVKNTIASILNIIFNCVVAFLYILSSYMVFTITRHQRIEDQGPGTGAETNAEPIQFDCNATLYYFTYWFISLTLGLILFFGLLAILLCAYNRYRMNIIRGSTPRSQVNVPNLSGHTNPAFVPSSMNGL